MVHGQALLPREGPIEMGGIVCGEMIEEEVEEAWWLGNLGGRLEVGKLVLLFVTTPCQDVSGETFFYYVLGLWYRKCFKVLGACPPLLQILDSQ